MNLKIIIERSYCAWVASAWSWRVLKEIVSNFQNFSMWQLRAMVLLKKVYDDTPKPNDVFCRPGSNLKLPALLVPIATGLLSGITPKVTLNFHKTRFLNRSLHLAGMLGLLKKPIWPIECQVCSWSYSKNLSNHLPRELPWSSRDIPNCSKSS